MCGAGKMSIFQKPLHGWFVADFAMWLAMAALVSEK
jgi:hypothetical protein